MDGNSKKAKLQHLDFFVKMYFYLGFPFLHLLEHLKTCLNQRVVFEV